MSESYPSAIKDARPFPCACGGLFQTVVDSRANVAGRVRRRRKCTECSARVTTYEITHQEADRIYREHLRLMSHEIRKVLCRYEDLDPFYQVAHHNTREAKK